VEWGYEEGKAYEGGMKREKEIRQIGENHLLKSRGIGMAR